MSSSVDITIEEDGTLRAIYCDELVPLLAEGDVTIRRASHVEPTTDGKWEADMSPSGGGVLGPFVTRGEALAAEVAWLKKECEL